MMKKITKPFRDLMDRDGEVRMLDAYVLNYTDLIVLSKTAVDLVDKLFYACHGKTVQCPLIKDSHNYFWRLHKGTGTLEELDYIPYGPVLDISLVASLLDDKLLNDIESIDPEGLWASAEMGGCYITLEDLEIEKCYVVKGDKGCGTGVRPTVPYDSLTWDITPAKESQVIILVIAD